MRVATILMVAGLLLALTTSCVDPTTDGGDSNTNSNDNGNTNTNDNTNVNDNGNVNDNANVNDNGGNQNDNGAMGGDCAGLDLTGHWTQDMNTLGIVQTGADLTSIFDEPFECDPEDSGPVEQETEDFQATIDGCDITGVINVCRFGCDATSTFECGVVSLDMTGTIDPSGDRFEIDVSDAATGDSITLIYNRHP